MTNLNPQPARLISRPMNRLLAFLAVSVLVLTIWILFWLRQRTVRDVEKSIEATVASFEPPVAFLGEPTERVVDFHALETLVQSAKRSPYILDVTVTKNIDHDTIGIEANQLYLHIRNEIGSVPSDSSLSRENESSFSARSIPTPRINQPPYEIPVVPYNLLALKGERQWLDDLRQLPSRTLSANNRLYGQLYFVLDTSSVRNVNWAIGAASAALIATLLVLLGRLFSQQTTIQKVGTELDQRTRELVRLERLALAGQLTAGLLHDLKKPVLNIRHRMEDLGEELAKTLASEEAIKGTRQEIDLFFQMLNDSSIEKFVRSDRVSEEYVDLNEILKTATRLVHYERGAVNLLEYYDSSLPPILAQPYRLVQVFSNLILNAYQAMKAGGTLTLQTRKADNSIEARVADDGPGIPPEALQRIFEPFFTTKGESEGSGLGLAISKLIIEDMGGTIDVESKVGGPTAFIVKLKADE